MGRDATCLEVWNLSRSFSRENEKPSQQNKTCSSLRDFEDILVVCIFQGYATV